MGYSKTEKNVSMKTFDESLKYQYQCSGHLKEPFSYAITGYGPKQLLSGRHRSQSHKSLGQLPPSKLPI